jgi:hypothetical protein
MTNLPINHNIFNNIQLEPELEPMRKGTAKSWLGEYHWVQLPITDANKYLDTTAPAIEWCKEYFGKSGTRWFEKKKKFYFKDEKDMTLFILKFCS